MTETSAVRKKRLLHQSRYRGQLENDLLLGRFAERFLPDMDLAELDQYEGLLNELDVDIFAWVTGRAAIPARQDHAVLRRLIAMARHEL